MIINSHTHILKRNTKEYKYAKLEDLKKDMHNGNISSSIIISWFKSDKEEYNTKELLKKIENEKNFYVIGTLDLDNIKTKEIKELENFLKKNLIKGIKFYFGYNYVFPTDKKLGKLYKLCEKYNVPALFHSGDTLNEEKNAKIQYSHPIHIDSVAVDYPKLKIIVCHLGNPWLIDAAEIIYKNENVYGDVSGFFIGFNNKEYIEFMKKKLNEFIAYAGAEKLLFGTDFPLVKSVDYIKFIKSLDLDKKQLNKIFYDNAKRLFKI